MMNYHKKLAAIVENAARQISLIDEDKMSRKPQPDKWSKKEILGHLVDSAFNNHARFLKAGLQNDLIFEGYNQDEWVQKNNYQIRPAKEITNLWQQNNQHICYLIEAIPEDLLLKKTRQHEFHKMCMQMLPEGEEANLAYLIWDYTYHIEYHLLQIIDGYEVTNGPFLH